MTDIKVYENISIVTFSDVPSRKRFVSTTLSAVAESGINVDMISQTPPKSDMFSFGFTFSDDDIPTLLTVLPRITAVHGITPVSYTHLEKLRQVGQSHSGSIGSESVSKH